MEQFERQLFMNSIIDNKKKSKNGSLMTMRREGGFTSHKVISSAVMLRQWAGFVARAVYKKT